MIPHEVSIFLTKMNLKHNLFQQGEDICLGKVNNCSLPAIYLFPLSWVGAAFEVNFLHQASRFVFSPCFIEANLKKITLYPTSKLQKLFKNLSRYYTHIKEVKRWDWILIDFLRNFFLDLQLIHLFCFS